MVYNCFIKCQVCGGITRVRLQVGWQKEHPIVVTCGKCGTSLSGKVAIGQDNPDLKFEFDNAEVLNGEEKADYAVECSGEFPTNKQCEESYPVEIISTPFIRNINRMKSYDGYKDFGKAVSELNETAGQWKNYKRILDLFQNQNRTYLVQEIHKIFSENDFPCRNEFEILRAVHMIEVCGFISPLRKDIISDLTISSGILKLNAEQVKKLIDFLNNNDGYGVKELQTLVYKMLGEFMDIYSALIPALVLQYYEEDAVDLESEGSTTSNFDSVKQFYLDSYEALGNLLIIPVALNNIKYRDDFDRLAPIDKRATSMQDFIGLTKANRYHFCVDSEQYTDLLHVIANSKLRNAIGHNDVGYDTISQQITYIPNPKDRTKKEMTYLLEFENQALRLFQGIITIAEYLYRIREMELMFEGNVPIVPQQTIKKQNKTGRNDPCPCGSGLKYKFCHGKNH